MITPKASFWPAWSTPPSVDPPKPTTTMSPPTAVIVIFVITLPVGPGPPHCAPIIACPIWNIL